MPEPSGPCPFGTATSTWIHAVKMNCATRKDCHHPWGFVRCWSHSDLYPDWRRTIIYFGTNYFYGSSCMSNCVVPGWVVLNCVTTSTHCWTSREIFIVQSQGSMIKWRRKGDDKENDQLLAPKQHLGPYDYYTWIIS